MILNRRGFLGGLLAALTVPAVIKLDGLIAVSRETLITAPDYLWMAQFDIYRHRFTVNAIAREVALEKVVQAPYRALPEQLCADLTKRYGHLCRPDAELEMYLTEEQMMLPRFGSLVPQHAVRRMSQGSMPGGADLDKADELQRRIRGDHVGT